MTTSIRNSVLAASEMLFQGLQKGTEKGPLKSSLTLRRMGQGTYLATYGFFLLGAGTSVVAFKDRSLKLLPLAAFSALSGAVLFGTLYWLKPAYLEAVRREASLQGLAHLIRELQNKWNKASPCQAIKCDSLNRELPLNEVLQALTVEKNGKEAPIVRDCLKMLGEMNKRKALAALATIRVALTALEILGARDENFANIFSKAEQEKAQMQVLNNYLPFTGLEDKYQKQIVEIILHPPPIYREPVTLDILDAKSGAK